MKRLGFLFLAVLSGSWTMVAGAQEAPPLLPEQTARTIANELSGEIAKRNLEFLARLHRQRGSHDFHTAAEFVAAQLRRYGIGDAHTEQFTADGKTMYGTQKARLPWDGQFGELWELREQSGQWLPAARLCDFEAMPVTLAEDSSDAEVTADLVDVGAGTTEKDYQGKDVRGKIVLASEQPGATERLAVERFSAAGIVSYALNQPQAWQGEDENLIRWGHLDSFPKAPTFAFMISLKTARELRTRLARGETIRLHAAVRAGRHPGSYDVVTGTIPGADAKLKADEIVFSCHLDHERPGANDNASGCVTILEVARTLQKLVAEGKIPRPARTIRFVWPAEIEGTLALLNSKPELVPHIRAVVHMDMVGGGPVTKAIFHVTRAPASLPSFVNDVGEAFTDFVNRQSDEFASTGHAAYPFVAPEGGKEALLGQFAEFTAGSDHDVYEEGSYRIPAIYLNDWPDRYIHTNFDSAANIDPTKLLRAGFIGAASGYFLADFKPEDVPKIMQVVEAGSLRRTATMLRRRNELGAEPSGEAANLSRFHLQYERGVLESIARFQNLTTEQSAEVQRLSKNLEAIVGRLPAASEASANGGLVFARNAEPKGPIQPGFGYDYFSDHYGEERTRNVKIFQYQGLRGGGPEYAYEAPNFVDGKHSAQDIRDSVSAEYGPIPLDTVVEYLRALEEIGVVHQAK
jgi:aminopeptidase YwaD